MDLNLNPKCDPERVFKVARLTAEGGSLRTLAPPCGLTWTCDEGDLFGRHDMKWSGFVWQATVGAGRVSLDPGRGDQEFYDVQWKEVDAGLKSLVRDWPAGKRDGLSPLLVAWSHRPTITPPTNPDRMEVWVQLLVGIKETGFGRHASFL